MSAQKIRGILKKNHDVSLKPSKSASFDEISLMHTAQRTEVYIQDAPKPVISSYLSVTSLARELEKVSESIQYDFNIDTEEDSSDDEHILSETIEERVQRLEFERRRSLHYNEFQTVQLARRLINEEFSNLTESIESENFSEFMVSSCEAEECPFTESEDELKKSKEQILAEKLFSETYYGEPETEPEVAIEPGFTPSHPCYHQLMATKSTELPEQTLPNVDPI
ncbi:protein phosphatase inhibitor 2 family member C-like [Drosophila obscura]|uniref:protein phosphatase inhibitor 2 family member C-like n=1 Tax=Drosophila obscura TaxID=7282 RepID=UPI000BA047F1|nr:protein phosphatase inhibitor 2 family member C-like [Drosophila obscura]